MEPHARSLTGTPRRVVVAFLVFGPDVDAQELAAARGGGFGGGAKRLVIGEAKILAKPHHRASRGGGVRGCVGGRRDGRVRGVGIARVGGDRGGDGVGGFRGGRGPRAGTGRRDGAASTRRRRVHRSSRVGTGETATRVEMPAAKRRAPSAPPSKARAATPCPRASSMRRGLETGDPARLRRAVGCGARRGVTSTKSRRRFGQPSLVVASVVSM